MTSNPLISVVVVTWNNEKDIQDCLSSLLKQSYSNFNIILVDNNSSDKTVEIVRNKFIEVEILQQSENLFLTGANNKGILHAVTNYNPDFILVLNPDTYAHPDLIQELLKPLITDENVGATGPKVMFWKNECEGLINSAGLIYDGFMQAYDIGFKEEDKGQYDDQKEVFGVTGACILYRVKMLEEIGLYDNKIKMYLDEVELFIRARQSGWKIIYTPNAVIGHNYMQSTNQNKVFNRQKQVLKAWLIIALKHYPIKSKLAMIKHYLKDKFNL